MGIKKGLKPKISKAKIAENRGECVCHSHPVFCFKYLTTNSNYNFDFFGKDTNKRRDASVALIERLEEISKLDWKEFYLCDKKHGCETMDITFLNFKICDELRSTLTNDTKFLSIRFKNQKYRLIGIRKSTCAVLHIIGYDFDYSAYNHGS